MALETQQRLVAQHPLLRYGQVPIPIDDGGQALIGTLEEVAAFYAAVAVSIERGSWTPRSSSSTEPLGRADEEGEPACQSGLADPTTCGLSCRWARDAHYRAWTCAKLKTGPLRCAGLFMARKNSPLRHE